MSDEKRTFESIAHLQPGSRLQARKAKGKKLSQELAPVSETADSLEQDPQPVTQDLILRLIKLLKES